MDIDPDYQCVMEPVTPATTLKSYTWTIEMRRQWIVNFSIPRSWAFMSRKRRRKWLRHLDRHIPTTFDEQTS